MVDELRTGELAELERQVRTQLAAVEASLAQAESSAGTVELDQQRQGRLSRMDALQQQAMAQASVRQLGRERVALKRALARFETGDYGWCEDCGEPIGVARLRVRPESEYCIQCQDGQDV